MQILFLLAQNAAIGTTQTWEPGEKQVNDLEIRIFIQDSVNTAQLTLLDALGSLCPNVSGEAVLRAQVLYNRFVEKEFAPVCTGARGGAGERAEDNPEMATSFSVYPNPNMATSFVVMNAYGQTVRSVEMAEGTRSISLDLTQLPSGLYRGVLLDAQGRSTASEAISLHR